MFVHLYGLLQDLYFFSFLLFFSKLWSIDLSLYCFLLLLGLKVEIIWQIGQNYRKFLQDKKKILISYVVFGYTSFAFIILTMNTYNRIIIV